MDGDVLTGARRPLDPDRAAPIDEADAPCADAQVRAHRTRRDLRGVTPVEREDGREPIVATEGDREEHGAVGGGELPCLEGLRDRGDQGQRRRQRTEAMPLRRGQRPGHLSDRGGIAADPACESRQHMRSTTDPCSEEFVDQRLHRRRYDGRMRVCARNVDAGPPQLCEPPISHR